MSIRYLALTLAVLCPAWCAEPPNFCQPSPELTNAFEKAVADSAAITEPFAALDRAAPFLAVRDQYPDSLLAHERYQDAIHENGIEGHLQLLTKQYVQLEAKHPGDTMYRYLRVRSSVGRNTPQAIKDLNDLLVEHPDFAPAHQTLAEIYGTEAFRQQEKEQSEGEKYLAACPSGTFTKRPPAVPEPTKLIDQAETMLADGGDPAQIIQVIFQGLREANWRTQRIRAFDWFGRDYKIQNTRELWLRYYEAWPIQVRCYLRSGHKQMADQLLARMENGLANVRVAAPGRTYWNTVYTLAQLYVEAEEPDQANQKLRQLQQLAGTDSDSDESQLRGSQYEKLRDAIAKVAK